MRRYTSFMIWNFPNILTVMRLVAAPGIVVMFLYFSRPMADWLALALFLIAADLGITLEQSKKMEIELKDLFVGAKEVTVDNLENGHYYIKFYFKQNLLATQKLKVMKE